MNSSNILDIATQIMVLAIIISVVLLFVGVGVLVLLHVCIVGRAFRQGLSTIGRGERCSDTTGGLSSDDLEKLPCYSFMEGEKGRGAVDCAVCLETFQMGDRCRLLPRCKHSFHALCVDSWLSKMPICPICRTRVDHDRGGGSDKVPGEQQGRGLGFELMESRTVVIGFPDTSRSLQIKEEQVTQQRKLSRLPPCCQENHWRLIFGSW